MWSNHAKGDPFVDDLRAARKVVERTMNALRAAVSDARDCVDGYECGPYLDDLVDRLEDGGIESLDSHSFQRWSQNVIAQVTDASWDEQRGEKYPVPENETWMFFNTLGAALKEHGKALRYLAGAEKRALPSSVNV